MYGFGSARMCKAHSLYITKEERGINYAGKINREQ